MKIVIDARESGTSTGRYVDKLIDYLQEIDKTNQYTLLYKQGRFDQVHISAPNFTKVVTKYKEFSFGEQFGFAIQLYKLKADLVHFPIVQHPVLYFKKCTISMLDLSTLRFKNPSKNKIIFWIRQRVYWCVNLAATRQAKRIIAISNYVANDISKTFWANKNKITTTYNAADLIKEPAEVVDGLLGKKYIMYVGRPQTHKNIERLIDAFALIQKNIPELYLVLAGKKDILMDGHEKYVQEHKISNVVFTGFVSDQQLRWLYENTACYVFPSLSEGFGLPGLEAMKHGAPVASSNATCLPEIYGDAAAYFSPYSTQEMAEVITDVLTNKKLRATLIAKGKKQASKYSWQRMAEQTLAVYGEVAGTQGRK